MTSEQLKQWSADILYLQDINRKQADRIAELEKNVEPVAIVNTNCENNIQWNVLKPQSYNGYFLFTTPQTKPLSDEEIWKIYGITGLGKGMALRFARAIEAKVRGEK